MGLSQSKQENNSTINWDNIKTENVSLTLPSYNNLSQDAKNLISNLDTVALSDSSSVNITELLDGIHSKLNIQDKTQFTNMLNEISEISDHNENLSATSPFMSKEDYNKYLNSTTSENVNQQKGGMHEDVNQHKGGMHEDDSSTSSTSSLSSSSSDDEPSSHEKPIHKKVAHKKSAPKKNKKKQHRGGSSEDNSYLSSSAHTGGNSSEINNNISPATEDINSVSSD
jgi:hypothetical protein